MGRPQNPVDPQAGPVQRFAYELRKLRDEAGAPAYRDMARRAGYSAATLSQAAAGARLPTLPVLLAYVEVCSGDTGYWQQLWEEAEGELAQLPLHEDEDADPPYRGLARFEPNDAELFFGRGELAGQVEETARRHRVSALVGASGSGKSSLLRAGLVPRLRRINDAAGEPPAAVRILTPGAHPLANGQRLVPGPGPGDTWVLVDQFEELFTLCADAKERDEFLRLLLAARDDGSRLRVVLAVRADFFGRCADHSALAAALKDATLLVGPMDREQYREAVVGPAAAHGLIVEKDLTARVVEEVVDNPGALPLMSHALMETWRRRRGRMLTVQAYESAGGLHGSITRTAEDTYGRLTPAQASLARRILLRLIAPGNGTEDTHRPAPRTEFESIPGSADTAAVVDHLARARLLTLDDGNVCLAHEAVINAWPRLRHWISEEREHIRLHRQLTHDATTWQELSRDEGSLYRGSRLDRVEEAFAEGERSALNSLEAAFLDAGLAAQAAEREQTARVARRSRRVLVALAMLCVLLLLAGTLAWQQKRSTDHQQAQAEARRIASLATGLRTTDPVRAMRLSVAAWHLAQTPETRGAILGALSRRELDALSLPAGDNVSDPFLTTDGRTLVYPGKNRIRRWDVRTHRELPPHKASTSELEPHLLLSATRDGGTAVMEQNDYGVMVYRTADGTTKKYLPHSLSFSELTGDGNALLSWDTDAVELWDWQHGRLLFRRTLPDSSKNTEMGEVDVAVSPDGGHIAACSNYFPSIVWDVERGRREPPPWRQERCDDSTSQQFTDDGKILLRSEDGKGAEARDLRSGRKLWQVKHSGLTEIEVSSDGSLLAGRDDGEILVWRTSHPQYPALRYATFNEEVSQLRLDTAQRVLRYVGGGAVRTLSLEHLTARTRGKAELEIAQFSPDASQLATSRIEKERIVYQLRNALSTKKIHMSMSVPCAPMEEIDLERCNDRPYLSFRPDGRQFAYGSPSGARGVHLHLWDSSTRRHINLPEKFRGYKGNGFRALFSPHGDSLLFSEDDGGRDGAGSSTRRLSSVEKIGRWRIGNGPIRSLHEVEGDLLAAHPDGNVVAVGGEYVVGRLVDIRTGRVVRRSLTSAETVAVAFSPDGRFLAAGDSAGRVDLWDGLGQRRLGQLLPGTEGTDGHEQVNGLAFSPDGSTLAVATEKGILSLWDTNSNQPLGNALPTAPDDPLLAVAFTPDGNTLRTVGQHTTVQSYTTAPDRAARTLCKRAHGGLTRTEWQSYLPAVPYRSTC
ncbi:hypothetical protein AB0D04_37395 [Streptomyces sp. NPDC048483]|uniref:nSTAND1 domain-containing NTPase n=1 Tax=Streptomyces sp. NPDC048483 TaxID=3154927 RepID=UPI003439EB2A